MKLKGYGIELSEVTEDKIEKIRNWRNHPEIVDVMIDQSVISVMQQKDWFHALANKKDCLYLIISFKGQDIGVMSAKSISNEQSFPLMLKKAKKISPGLYIAPDSKYKNSVLAFSPSLVFIDYLFKQGCCVELEAQVFEHNIPAIRYNKTLGYCEKEVDQQGLLTMTLNIDDFKFSKQQLSKILRF